MPLSVKNIAIGTLLLTTTSLSTAMAGDYDVSEEHPFGQPHPEAPEALSDFAFAIGKWSCDSNLDVGAEEWVEGTLDWEFRYILNGKAVQDYFQTDAVSGMGIRQINPADGLWYVAFHSMHPGYSNGMWSGEKAGDDIVLNRFVTQADGNQLNMRLTFYDIGEDSFKWRGENVVGETVTPFWYIACDERVE